MIREYTLKGDSIVKGVRANCLGDGKLLEKKKRVNCLRQDKNSSTHNFLLDEDIKMRLVWKTLIKAKQSRIFGQFSKPYVAWNDVDGLPGNYA